MIRLLPYLQTTSTYLVENKGNVFSFHFTPFMTILLWSEKNKRQIDFFFQISVSLTQRNLLSIGFTSIVFFEVIEEFSKISKKINVFSKLLSNISCLFFFQIFS